MTDSSAQTIRFTIPYPAGKQGKTAFCRQYGLNTYYAGKDWHVRQRDDKTLHALALAAMHRAHIKAEPLRVPAEVSFYWDDGLDVDNHAVMGKAFVDAMKGKLLQNDNRKWLKGVRHRFWNGGSILVEITPAEWEEQR